MTDTIVTRFAPSPTGMLHIGGARTALFCWLLARNSGGKYLLRIEDTDKERSTPAARDAILNGLNWLGLSADEEPVYQSARADRHREIALQLLAAGKAYRCYATADELEEMRETARAEGRPTVYDGRWRDRDPSDAPSGVDGAVRLKTEAAGQTIVNDLVQGDVSFDNSQLDDMIILRSDGTPTYMLAVVVDDHDMGITHVIRGDDHLNNAARQLQLIKALGWPTPTYAHVPMIHGPDGAKLSKRHGATSVEAYRDLGYLPEAMRNYLVRLGWSHGDDEIFSTDQAIEWFSLQAIGKSPARMDFAKLDHVNSHYIRQADETRLVEDTLDIMGRVKGWQLPDSINETLALAMPGLKERAKTLVELAESASFLVRQRPLDLDDKAAQMLTDDARAVLRGLLADLRGLDAWSLELVEQSVRKYAKDNGLKLGKVAQPIRAALTGRATSPGIFDVLTVLGRDEALARIEDQTC